MTVEELQRLFDAMGPEWRVFVRSADLEEPPAFEWITAGLTVMGLEDGWFVVAFPDQYSQPIFMSIKEPVPVTPPGVPGTLLRAERRDPTGLVLAEFSTVTLTPDLRAQIRRNQKAPA